MAETTTIETIKLLFWLINYWLSLAIFGLQWWVCISKGLCPTTAHQATYTGSPCGSRVHGGRPSFRRYKRTPHSWIRKKKDGWWMTPTLKMVFIKTPGGRQQEATSLREEDNGKPPLYFS